MEQVLIAVVATMAFTVVFFGGGTVLYLRHKNAEARETERLRVQNELVRVLGDHAKSMDTYSERLKTAEAGLADLPKLVEGLGRIAGSQVVEISKFRQEVARFTGILSKPNTHVPEFEMPTEQDKDYAWRAQQMQLTNPGMTTEDAIKRVVEEDVGAMGVKDFTL